MLQLKAPGLEQAQEGSLDSDVEDRSRLCISDMEFGMDRETSKLGHRRHPSFRSRIGLLRQGLEAF